VRFSAIAQQKKRKWVEHSSISQILSVVEVAAKLILRPTLFKQAAPSTHQTNQRGFPGIPDLDDVARERCLCERENLVIYTLLREKGSKIVCGCCVL
jgi:hypothetical protein